jgi:crotonobetainyl-CoA:carnitine CoA-transferase CaiB-like acyl-CoA transferase
MPVSRVGAIGAATPEPPTIRMAAGRAARGRRLRVLDLSSLWAGPLCGALMAQAGAEVTKIESVRRPDTLAQSSPAFFARLNDAKTGLALDFADPSDRARLFAEAARSDVLITGARPRAFGPLGLSPDALFAANPGVVWVAITGYGWDGPLSGRVAFGDDAAAAGGLVHWTPQGPRFLADALADPLTGLAAAAGAFRALSAGGVIVDAAMARIAAGAAAQMAAEAPA